MRNVRYLAEFTLDDTGTVTRCRVGSLPGASVAFSIEHTGPGCVDRCASAVRQNFKMEAYRGDFDHFIGGATTAEENHVTPEAA